MVKRKKMRGMGDKLTKEEVLQDPAIASALLQWHQEKQMGSGRMMGKGWWSDFTDWLKKNHVISNLASIGSAITGAVGLLPLSAGLAVASGASSIAGYGYVNNLSRIGTKRMSGGSSMLGSGMIYSQNGTLVNQPKMSGGGVLDFVKKHKLVSRGLEGLASVVPLGSNAMNTQGTKNTLYRFANAAKMAGYGTTAFNTVSTEFSNVQF
jgi:hypothetical protein